MKRRTKENIYLAVLVCFFLMLQGVMVYMDSIGEFMFNGVFSAMQFGLCLLMLRVNPKRGLRVSMVLMGFAIIMLIRALNFVGSITALPGLCNSVFYVITIILLAFHSRNRERESITDILTGTLNRRGMYRYLKNKMDEKMPFKVIYITIDNYSFINETYGRNFGDEMMKLQAGKMSKILEKAATYSRIGGSDFLIAIDGGVDAEGTINTLLEAIRERCVLSIDGESIEFYTVCYAGMSAYPGKAENYEDLIHNADIAMHEAKAKDIKTVVAFDEKMADRMSQQIAVEKLIKEGLENNYFYTVYQPQFYMDEKRLRGFEVLIRMRKPDNTIVSPGVFIPVAEKGDLIFKIDKYVIRHATETMKSAVLRKRDMIISINVSAKNIGHPEFVNEVSHILRKNDFPPENLEIEITEYCMLESMETSIRNITRLRDMGIHVALDDFGTGYTSLSYVSKLPINLLKIDKSMIDDIEKNERSRNFVRTVVALGHEMDCQVISEGVESESQLNLLMDDGCDMVQGYVWGKPQEFDDAMKLVDDAIMSDAADK